MKTRMKTKHGMCTIEPSNDPNFKKVIFDNKVALGGYLSCRVWLINIEKMKEL